MSSDDSSWEKILQDKIQSATPLSEWISNPISNEIPYAVDLSNHHLHDQVLSEVRQTFQESVVADHIIEHLFPQIEPSSLAAPLPEVNHSFQYANPSIEAFQASGTYQQDSVPDQNSNSFLDTNQSLPDFGVDPAEPFYEPLYEPQEQQALQESVDAFPLPNEVHLQSNDQYHSIPREEHDHMQVTRNLFVANMKEGYDSFERERGLEQALDDQADGLAFKLEQEMQSHHIPSHGDNGEF